MEEEEAQPKRSRRLEPLALYPLGVTELRSYIEELRAEIARAEAEIGAKEGHRSAADAFFKRPEG